MVKHWRSKQDDLEEAEEEFTDDEGPADRF